MVTITHIQHDKVENDTIDKRGLLSKIHKPSIISKIYTKKKDLFDNFDKVMNGILKIKDLKSDKEFNESLSEEDSSLIEGLLERVFIGLKNADLINPILKFSLTDEKVRAGLIDITIELLKADVIPWYEIFVALNDSGLAVDTIKFLITDPETRQGQIDLILELIPRLIEDGIISLEDLLKRIPRIKLPDLKIDVPSRLRNLTTEEVLGSLEGILHYSDKSSVMFNETDHSFHILPIIPDTDMISSTVWETTSSISTIPSVTGLLN